MKLFLAILLLICSLQTAFAVQQTHPEATADTLMSMRYRQGLAATRAGLYNDALRYWLDYLEIAGDFPDKTKTDDLLTAYLAVGSVHFTFEDYESAVTFFRKGNDVATKAGREDSRIRFLNNLVGAYTELGDVVRADSCNEAMNVLARKIDAKGYEHNYLFNKGYIAREKKDYPNALRYMRLSLAEMQKERSHDSPVYAYSEMYAIFESMGQLDSALYYLKRFEQTANKPYLQLDCYKGLMRVYTKLGNNDESLRYQNLYFHVSDSVLNSRDFMQTRNSWLFNERQQTQQHIAGLEENVFRWRLGIILISIVLVLIVAFVVVLLVQKRKLNAMNADLFERNRELIDLHDRLTDEWRRRKSVVNADADECEVVKGNDDKGNATAKGIPDTEADDDKMSDLLARIIEFMETSEKYLDPEFLLSQLAKEVDSNTKYVSQVINERTGQTFRVFINKYRITVAMKRIMDYDAWGHLTIKSIGESVGFKSAANFIAAFKKVTGMTPSVYMNMSRQEQSRQD